VLIIYLEINFKDINFSTGQLSIQLFLFSQRSSTRTCSNKCVTISDNQREHRNFESKWCDQCAVLPPWLLTIKTTFAIYDFTLLRKQKQTQA